MKQNDMRFDLKEEPVAITTCSSCALWRGEDVYCEPWPNFPPSPTAQACSAYQPRTPS